MLVPHGNSARYHGNSQSNHRCYGTTLSDRSITQIKYHPIFLPLQYIAIRFNACRRIATKGALMSSNAHSVLAALLAVLINGLYQRCRRGLKNEFRDREISRFAKTETYETESLALKNRDLGLGTGPDSLQYILQYQSLLTFYVVGTIATQKNGPLITMGTEKCLISRCVADDCSGLLAIVMHRTVMSEFPNI